MKHPNSGFYSFGKSLGNAVITQNKGRYKLYYYVYEKANWLFEKKVSLVFLSWVHKIYFGEPNRFALVHFTDQFCRLHPQKVNGKKVITIHDLNFIHEKSKTQRKIDKRLGKMRGFIDACDKVVAISNFVAADILKYCPEAAGKLSVI